MHGYYLSLQHDVQANKRRGYSAIGYVLARSLDSLPDLALNAIVDCVGPMGRALSRVGREVELARLRRQLLRPHRLGEDLDQAVQRFDELLIERQETAC